VKFELVLPGEIRFGAGTVKTLAASAKAHGRRPLIVTGKSSLSAGGHLGEILHDLKGQGMECTLAQAGGEPSAADVDGAALLARTGACDLVIAIGGGRSIDLAKAAAGLIPNGSRIRPYLEAVGDGSVFTRDPLPFIAVPTTAGTGSEATRNAVIGTKAEGFKRSVRDIRLMPRLALIDPVLALSCPPEVTLAAGMDALTQLIEALTSRRVTPPIEALCLSGIAAAGEALPRLARDGSDLEARTKMAYAACMSGIGLAHAGLGVVHALASSLGGLGGVPHTTACAVLLPAATALNRRVLAQGRGDGGALDRYQRAEASLGCDIASFCAKFPFRAFRHFGVDAAMIPSLVAGAGAGNLKANPADLSPDEIARLLESAL
jgi:alcohol dehydrogenase class IV